ncbi:MAG: hypothetical protein ABR592_01980 [Nitriliruptorales bacterium]
MKTLVLGAALIGVLAVGCGEAEPAVAPPPPPPPPPAPACNVADTTPPWEHPCPGAVERWYADQRERVERFLSDQPPSTPYHHHPEPESDLEDEVAQLREDLRREKRDRQQAESQAEFRRKMDEYRRELEAQRRPLY